MTDVRPAIDILLPTIRWNDHVRGLLGYLAAMVSSSSRRVELYIGDDSCNPEKHAYMETLRSERVHVFPHSARQGVHGNLAFLLERSSAEHVQQVDDDDWFHSDWLENVKWLQADSATVAVLGTAVLYQEASATVHNLGRRFAHEDAIGRATDYARYVLFERNANYGALALLRRSIMEVYAHYVAQHPISFWSHDQVLTTFALLSGKLLGTGAGLYVCDAKANAPLSRERVREMGESVFASTVRSGLADWHMPLLYYFHLAVEYATACLFRKLEDRISMDRRLQAANALYGMVCEGWRQNIYEPEKERLDLAMERHGILGAVRSALAQTQSAKRGIESLLQVVQLQNAALGARYLDFLEMNTHWRELA